MDTLIDYIDGNIETLSLNKKMNKYIGFCVLVVLFFVNGSVQCQAASNYSSDQEDSGEAYEKATKRTMAENCRSAETTDEDIEAFMTEGPDATYGAKCIHACLLKKFDIITENGKFNIAGTKELYELTAEDEDELNLRYTVIESCGSIEEDDECDLPEKIMNCLMKKGAEVGIAEW